MSAGRVAVSPVWPAIGRDALRGRSFRRAIERGNLLVAETTLRAEIPRPTLVDLLELTALIAVVQRWLAARDDATIEEVAHVVRALVTLGGHGHDAAYTALMDVAETASRPDTWEETRGVTAPPTFIAGKADLSWLIG